MKTQADDLVQLSHGSERGHGFKRRWQDQELTDSISLTEWADSVTFLFEVMFFKL